VSVLFGDFSFDSSARALRRGDGSVHLSQKALELLDLLVRARPRALPRSELIECLWPDRAVSDSSLAKLVNELRRALGDDASAPRYVRTVHRFGLAFVAEARSGEARRKASSFRLVCAERDLALLEGENVLGRAAEAEVRVDSLRASRRHARIVVCDTQATIEDLGSKNGTYLQGRLVQGPAPLAPGDLIAVGGVSFVLRLLSPALSTLTDRDDSTLGRRPSHEVGDH